jgi:hypothetical protein
MCRTDGYVSRDMLPMTELTLNVLNFGCVDALLPVNAVYCLLCSFAACELLSVQFACTCSANFLDGDGQRQIRWR